MGVNYVGKSILNEFCDKGVVKSDLRGHTRPPVCIDSVQGSLWAGAYV